jgi:hypothetical protein
MPKLAPIKHHELINRMRRLGFSEPSGGGHGLYMMRGTQKVSIPNPHEHDMSLDELRRMLDQAGISVEEWESA